MTEVTKVRVTYVAARAASAVAESLANPDRFERLLRAPARLAGLDLSLPFLQQDGGRAPNVELNFWSKVTEQNLLDPDADRYGWRRGGLPLRHLAPSRASDHQNARIEVFLYPFGWVVAASVDIEHSPGVPFASLPEALSADLASDVRVTVADRELISDLPLAAEHVADMLFELIAPRSTSFKLDGYRIASVIAATGELLAGTMPTPGGRIHRSFHDLACGGPALADPGDAFLPYWTGAAAKFGWANTELVYVLDRGCAQFRQKSALRRPAAPRWGTSEYHRLLTLARVHLSADRLLLLAARSVNSERLKAWSHVAAMRLSRLYGPKPASYDFWDMTWRSFIRADPATALDIKSARGDNLELFAATEWPSYPTEAPGR